MQQSAVSVLLGMACVVQNRANHAITTLAGIPCLMMFRGFGIICTTELCSNKTADTPSGTQPVLAVTAANQPT
jgi:hypothetical protein